jgi:hypothetical protein
LAAEFLYRSEMEPPAKIAHRLMQTVSMRWPFGRSTSGDDAVPTSPAHGASPAKREILVEPFLLDIQHAATSTWRRLNREADQDNSESKSRMEKRRFCCAVEATD